MEEIKKTIEEAKNLSQQIKDEHDKAIKWRHKIKKDFPPDLCGVKIGKILKINNKDAVIKTKLGKIKIILDFIPNVKVGDIVTAHYEYGCEIIDENLIKKFRS